MCPSPPTGEPSAACQIKLKHWPVPAGAAPCVCVCIFTTKPKFDGPKFTNFLVQTAINRFSKLVILSEVH